MPHLVSAGCLLPLGQAPAAGQCQLSALLWLQHTENAGSSGIGGRYFPGIDVWSDRAPSRLQGGVSIFQCGSVSGATAERLWLWGSHAWCRNGGCVLLGGCGVQKTLELSHAWKSFPSRFSCDFECVISPKGLKMAWPFLFAVPGAPLLSSWM